MHCDDCGFSRDLWTDGDLRTTLRARAALARQALDGAPRELQAELTRVLAPLADLPDDGVDTIAVHDLMHVLNDAGRLRHSSTTGAPGTVAQISTSGGGVPKLPVARARIGLGGVEGDAQQNRRHHGRPWQAVCLWSAEVIEGLQSEGHPIGFGSAGENVTVRGLDWSLLSPGLRLGIGSAVVQLSAYAVPCVKNARWFADGDFSRMSQDVRPGASRIYASVLVPGVAQPGDAVVVEPAFDRDVQLVL